MNIGHFSYESFIKAHKQDQGLQGLVRNFDKNTVYLKTSETDDLPQGSGNPDNTVSKMAKRATKLG